MRKQYEQFPFCPLDTTQKPRNWRTFYSHKPVNVLASGGSSNGCAGAGYVEWLMEAHGLTLAQARERIDAHAQHVKGNGLLSATFHPDDMATKPAPKTPRKATRIATVAPVPPVTPLAPCAYDGVIAALRAGNARSALAMLEDMIGDSGAMTPSALKLAISRLAA